MEHVYIHAYIPTYKHINRYVYTYIMIALTIIIDEYTRDIHQNMG